MIGILVEMEPQDWIKLYKEKVISYQKLKEKIKELKNVNHETN
jgi:hypothetical protein